MLDIPPPTLTLHSKAVRGWDKRRGSRLERSPRWDRRVCEGAVLEVSNAPGLGVIIVSSVQPPMIGEEADVCRLPTRSWHNSVSFTQTMSATPLALLCIAWVFRVDSTKDCRVSGRVEAKVEGGTQRRTIRPEAHPSVTARATL